MVDAALTLHRHCDRDTRMVLCGDALLWRAFRDVATDRDTMASERLFGTVADAIVADGHDSDALWFAIQEPVPRSPAPHRDTRMVLDWARSLDSQYRARCVNFVQ